MIIGTHLDHGFWSGGECVALWRAVLVQALSDAKGLYAIDEVEQTKALRWLFEPNRDFRMVCDFISLSPELIREGAARVLLQPGGIAPQSSRRAETTRCKAKAIVWQFVSGYRQRRRR
jgi:hypothetical protein